MIKIETSKLTGAALDWAVAKIRLSNPIHFSPIITIKKIDDCFWLADNYDEKGYYLQFGSTELIAAMRCIVASEMGDEIEVPKELIK